MTKWHHSLLLGAGVALVAAAPVGLHAQRAELIERLQGQIRDLQRRIAALTENTASHSGALRFTRTLSLGDRGPEVRQLQKVLNATRGISVALRGAGSPGNETSYFGPKTRRAVVAFQERFADDVLAPAGLNHGTGVVGPSTRRKLNALSQSEGPVSPTASDRLGGHAYRSGTGGVDVYATDAAIADLRNEVASRVETQMNGSESSFNAPETASLGSFFLTSLSDGSVERGSELTLTVQGLSSDSYRVHFSDAYHLPKVEAAGRVTTVTVPDIPAGVYDVAVSSGNAVTNTRRLVVKDPDATPPSLSGAQPSVVSPGESVTLLGSGFTSDTLIETAFGDITTVSRSSSDRLTFTFDPEALATVAGGGDDAKRQPVYGRVVNRNGVSKTRLLFYVQL